MEGLDLTKTELEMMLTLVRGKNVRVDDPADFRQYQTIQKKILDYLEKEVLQHGGDRSNEKRVDNSAPPR